jgi:thymidylate synthase
MKATKTDLHPDGRPYTQEEFINKIKTDDEFAKKWGELGPIYGKQWRSWKINLIDPNTMEFVPPVDQIANLIRDLKTNPDSRRLMVNAWNVGELDQMVLPPCHYGFQVYTRELSEKERLDLFKVDSIDRVDSYGKWLDDNGYPKRAISLMWNQRSVDTGLGLGFNIASYGLLLEMIAKQVNMIPDELIGNLGDVHLYLDHVEPIKEQLNREPFNLPTLKIHGKVDDIAHYKVNDFELIGYQFHPTIKLPLSN